MKRIQEVHIPENLGDLNTALPFVDVSDGYMIKPSDSALRVTGGADSIVTLPVQDLVTIVGTPSGLFTIDEMVMGSVSEALGLVVSQTAESITVQMITITQFENSDTITGETSGSTVTGITAIDTVMLPNGKTISVSNGLSSGKVTIVAIGGPDIGNSTDDTSEVITAYSSVSTCRWDGTQWWILSHSIGAPAPPPSTSGIPYVICPSCSETVANNDGTANYRLAITLATVDGLPAAADLTPGTISMWRIRAGVKTLVYSGVACNVDTGLIYHDEAFSSASGWQKGDNYEARFDGQQVTIGTTTYDLPPIYLQGVVIVTTSMTTTPILPEFYEGWQIGSVPDPDYWAVVQSAEDTWAIYQLSGYLYAGISVGGPFGADNCSLAVLAFWDAMPTFGTHSIPQQLILEFELRCSNPSGLDGTATFIGLAPDQGDTFAAQNIMGFGIVDGALVSVTDNGGVRTTNTGFGEDLTVFTKLKIVVRNGAVDFYVNGVLVATHTTNIPAVAECDDFYFATPDENASDVGIGQVRCYYQ